MSRNFSFVTDSGCIYTNIFIIQTCKQREGTRVRKPSCVSSDRTSKLNLKNISVDWI